jgi:shikimate O-hydroxycinnamoyltransferase
MNAVHCAGKYRSSPRMSRIRSHLVSSELVRSGVKRPAQKLTASDLMVRHVGVAVFYVYDQGLDVERLRRALKETTPHHPMVTGRMQKDADGDDVVVGNDEGLLLEVFDCEGPMPKYGLNHPMRRDCYRFINTILPWRVIPKQTPLVQLGVYRFKDGGTVLSVQVVHSLMDGSTYWNFLQDLTAVAHGSDVAGPVQERDCLFELMQKAASAPDTRKAMAEPDLATKMQLYPKLIWQAFENKLGVYRISPQAIQAMKGTIPAGEPLGTRVSVADLVTAHAIKLMAPAQRHQGDRMLSMVSDLRYRKALNLPHRMFGNALAQESVTFSHQALMTQTDGELALTFKRPGAMHSTEESLGYLGMLERHRRAGTIGKLIPQAVVSAPEGGFVQNNYNHLPVYGLDLGTGQPSWFNPLAVPFRMLKIVPTPQGDGGVDIHLSVSKAEHQAFEQRYGNTLA